MRTVGERGGSRPKGGTTTMLHYNGTVHEGCQHTEGYVMDRLTGQTVELWVESCPICRNRAPVALDGRTRMDYRQLEMFLSSPIPRSEPHPQ